MRQFLPLFFLIILTACTPQTPSVDVDKQVINVYVDSFSEGWLPAIYTCAERSTELLVARTPDVDSANFIVSVNPVLVPDAVPYQLADLEFVLVANKQNPLEELSEADVQAIYTGQTQNWAELGWDDAPIHLWAYSPETGINDTLLGQGSLSTLAYQAQSPRAVRDAILQDIYAIGLLPRELITGEFAVISSQEIQSPILIFLPEERNALKSLAACLQTK